MLLPFASATILSHIIQEVKTVKPDSICLVTGFYHNEILKNIDTHELDVAYNENWKEGIAGSIRKGLSALLFKHSNLSSVLLLVSDQPHLNSELLLKMYTLHAESKKGIVAAKYGEITGTPVLFGQKYFARLQELKGDAGARTILHQNVEDIITIEFPLGAVDIDTPEDYERLCFETLQQHA